MHKHLHRALGVIAASLLVTIGVSASAEDAPLPLPEVKRINAKPAFPTAELRKKKEGTVDVEFSIDAKGIPRNITVTKSTSEAFDSSAKKVIGFARYEITEAWIAAGGPATRYRASVVFDVAPCVKPPPGSPDNPVILVCGEQVRR